MSFLSNKEQFTGFYLFMWFHQWSVFRDSVHHGFSRRFPILWGLKSSVLVSCKIWFKTPNIIHSFLHSCNIKNIFDNAYEHFNFPMMGKTSIEVGQTLISYCWEVIEHGKEDVLIGDHSVRTETAKGWGTDMSTTSVSGLSVWVWELSLLLCCVLFCFVLPSYFIFVASL